MDRSTFRLNPPLRTFCGPAIAIALVAIRTSPAAAVGSWTVVPTPDVSSQGNYLTSVAAVGSTDVWAVGAEYRAIGTPRPWPSTGTALRGASCPRPP
jgi:hypothetical protein